MEAKNLQDSNKVRKFLFKSVAIVIGNMEFEILIVFILAMARFTCMQADDIHLASCSSCIVRWSLLLGKGGIFILLHLEGENGQFQNLYQLLWSLHIQSMSRFHNLLLPVYHLFYQHIDQKQMK